jgi:hypothetical protein
VHSGDREFGGRIERIRDEVVYFSNRINFEEIRDLRERQIKEKSPRAGSMQSSARAGLLILNMVFRHYR